MQCIHNLFSMFYNSLFWRDTWAFLNSQVLTSLIGSLAGAFAGAYIAQKIAERSKQLEKLSSQIGYSNAAISSAFTITNEFLSIKKQYLVEKKKIYLADREAFILTKQHRRENLPVEARVFNTHFLSLPTLSTPIHVLEKLAHENLMLNGRAHACVSYLTQSVSEYKEAVERMNALNEKSKQIAHDQNALCHYYFGVGPDEGFINTEYFDTLNAVFVKNDDAIFFGELLCQDLVSYAEQVISKDKKWTKKFGVKINKVNFESAAQQGLLPDKEDYKSWLSGFQHQ